MCGIVGVLGGHEVAPMLDGDALNDPEILRLSTGLEMTESDKANDAFPGTRYARVTLDLTDGRSVTSDWMQPKWDPTAPPTAEEMRDKFHALADPVLGPDRAREIAGIVAELETRPLSDLTELLFRPV